MIRWQLLFPRRRTAAAASFFLMASVVHMANAQAAVAEVAPGDSISAAMSRLRAGDTLIIRGGTYTENIVNPSLSAGSASNRITVKAAPGEAPVVRGLLWLNNMSHWDIQGINVTWSTSNNAKQHMVKLTSGTGWTFTQAEVWGARSYAGILVAGNATNWRLANNYVHDTHKSNDTNQDHLIYVNTSTRGGVVENNVLANSLNGRGVKIGPPSATSGAVNGITIRHNTFYNNQGPSNVQVSWDSNDNLIYRNIFVKSGANRSAVTGFQLSGSGNSVYQNVYWDATAVADKLNGIVVGAGNINVDPQFTNAANGDFSAKNTAVEGYGATSTPLLTPTTTPVTTQAPVTSTTTRPTTSTTQMPFPTSTTKVSTTASPSTVPTGAGRSLIDESFTMPFKTTGGTWNLSGGQFSLRSPATVLDSTTGNGSLAIHKAVVQPGVTMSIAAKVVPSVSAYDDFTVVVGYVDASNYWFASFNERNDGGTNGLFQVADGVQTEVADFRTVITAGTTYRIDIEATGSRLSIQRDGVTVASSPASLPPSFRVGFGSRNDAADFDDLNVRRLG